MGYGKRIDTLCSFLTPAKVFADVGCDHGYCTEYMLKNGLCEKAIFSDVSKGSLAKAEKLLAKTQRSILEISEAVGFSSVSYFNRIFKRYRGCSPRGYRGARYVAINKGESES